MLKYIKTKILTFILSETDYQQDDPFAHPDIQAMSLRQLADLPLDPPPTPPCPDIKQRKTALPEDHAVTEAVYKGLACESVQARNRGF